MPVHNVCKKCLEDIGTKADCMLSTVRTLSQFELVKPFLSCQYKLTNVALSCSAELEANNTRTF